MPKSGPGRSVRERQPSRGSRRGTREHGWGVCCVGGEGGGRLPTSAWSLHRQWAANSRAGLRVPATRPPETPRLLRLPTACPCTRSANTLKLLQHRNRSGALDCPVATKQTGQNGSRAPHGWAWDGSARVACQLRVNVQHLLSLLHRDPPKGFDGVPEVLYPLLRHRAPLGHHAEAHVKLEGVHDAAVWQLHLLHGPTWCGAGQQPHTCAHSCSR
jgi:hypothetical protein